MMRELGALYGWLYGQLTRWTLGLWPMLVGYKLFWLVPGTGLFEAARHLARGTDAPRQPVRNLAALWAVVALVAIYAAARRFGS